MAANCSDVGGPPPGLASPPAWLSPALPSRGTTQKIKAIKPLMIASHAADCTIHRRVPNQSSNSFPSMFPNPPCQPLLRTRRSAGRPVPTTGASCCIPILVAILVTPFHQTEEDLFQVVGLATELRDRQ